MACIIYPEQKRVSFVLSAQNLIGIVRNRIFLKIAFHDTFCAFRTCYNLSVLIRFSWLRRGAVNEKVIVSSFCNDYC